MPENRVTLTELRQKLGKLLNLAAYGGERIVLVSRGEPKAAIVGIKDLELLRQTRSKAATQSLRLAKTLAAADRLQEWVCRWQKARGIKPGDVVRTVDEL